MPKRVIRRDCPGEIVELAFQQLDVFAMSIFADWRASCRLGPIRSPSRGIEADGVAVPEMAVRTIARLRTYPENALRAGRGDAAMPRRQ